MNRADVISLLREHEAELRAAGVQRLQLFGSVARNEATQDSDVDLLADFDPARRWSLVSLGSVQDRLRRILGTNVDLSSPAWLREHVKERAVREAVLVY